MLRPSSDVVPSSIDDLDHTVCPRIDEHRPVIHDCVAIIPNAVFGGHLVVGDPTRRKNRADLNLLLIAM
jgi:hypothetical protein